MQRQSCLSRSLRAVDFDNPALWQAANPQCDIEADRCAARAALLSPCRSFAQSGPAQFRVPCSCSCPAFRSLHLVLPGILFHSRGPTAIEPQSLVPAPVLHRGKRRIRLASVICMLMPFASISHRRKMPVCTSASYRSRNRLHDERPTGRLTLTWSWRPQKIRPNANCSRTGGPSSNLDYSRSAIGRVPESAAGLFDVADRARKDVPP